MQMIIILDRSLALGYTYFFKIMQNEILKLYTIIPMKGNQVVCKQLQVLSMEGVF